ncbi:MAG TPA: inositol monophosphatase [candidate division Zixibacteria bacterium]|nr:inositol monophosphatase [candidate division Zixibacteria bacterium]HBZ02053.1 inositol monophosphatase [candidate division Zixibacteria bacterium]
MSEFLDIAMRAARAAGSLLLEKQRVGFSVEKKGDVDLVTNADRESEALIRKIIFEKFPDHSFQAEEGTVSTQKSPYLWIVDPLDGTTNFAHSFPVWCVSIGLLQNGISIAGCVYNPNLDELFTAEWGEGAFLNGKKIAVSKATKLSEALLATGFPYDIRDSNKNNLTEFSAFAISAQAIRRAGSAALDLAYVACGRFDGYWEFKLRPWDIAAGVLLVAEAGGKITDWSGEKYDIDTGEVLSSNVLIHDEMLDVLKKVRGRYLTVGE